MKAAPQIFLILYLTSASVRAQPESGRFEETAARSYLERIIYTPNEVERWLAGVAFPFSGYDAELGWLVLPMRRRDGMQGSICTYTYDGPLGARRMINAADLPCRINTFGDSFTQCDQVSDGETWQEQLAAHVGEPIRNYGVGGYSVYQACLRMLRVEREMPSEVIILNIYEDDHYRNLDAWRNIRVSKHPLFIEPTLPHLKVDLATGGCIEMPNPCPTPESVRNLANPEWVVQRFRDDFVLRIMLAHENARLGRVDGTSRVIMDQATTIGINTRVDEGAAIATAADALHTRAALLSTMHIVHKVEEHARQESKKVLYVLSYRARSVARFLQDGARFDNEFVDFLRREGLDYVDLLEEHARDYARHSLAPDDYASLYYIGHYNPAGNAFTARAIRGRLVDLLDPPPPAYRVAAEDYWRRP